MKKRLLGFILLFFIASCTKNEYFTVNQVSPEPEVDKSTYTVMMYGCGGGNLDTSMVLNIQEALLAGATDRVNFTGQIKFSARFQQEEALAGTQRFIVGDAGETWYEPVEVLDSGLELFDPQNLTNFINWSKEQCPADEYILLLWNHGGAWTPWDDHITSRAVVFDDVNNNKGLTLNGLVKGIDDSGTHFKMVYYDACLMGMMEVITGLTACTDYVMAASHITPGMGGDYNSLIYHLNASTNFEEAMIQYCCETVAHWNSWEMPLDLMVVDCRKMDRLLGEVKLLATYLEEIARIYAEYDSTTEEPGSEKTLLCSAYEQAINACYHYDDSLIPGIEKPLYPYYDLLHFAEILSASGAVHSYSARFVDMASRINRAMSEAIVCKQLSSVINNLSLSIGVTIIDKDFWQNLGYQNAYNELLFEQKTGWGNWLKINPVTPEKNPNPETILGGQDDEEDDNDGQENKPTLEEEIALLLELIGKK